jgi:AraC-like DNA-binding protein
LEEKIVKLGALRTLTQERPQLEGLQLQQWVNQRLTEMGLDPHAIYQELEMTSPWVDTHRDVSYSNQHLQLHSHTFYELLYCCNDCGAEYLVGSERYRLQEGDIVFVPPGVSHRPLLPENMTIPYERYVLWLSPEFMTAFAGLFPYDFAQNQTGASMLRTGGTPWEFLRDYFRIGVQEAQKCVDGWEAAVIGNTVTLLTQIKRATDQHTARRLTAEAPELLDRLTAYVEENYAKPITMAELSRQYYISTSTISHLFKQKLGVSFYRYVTQRRLIAAKTLIEKGHSLEDVAAQTGFSDYSGFYRAFKQEYGISPQQYRSIQEANEKPDLPK